MGARFFFGVKLSGCEIKHSPSSRTEVQNECDYISSFIYIHGSVHHKSILINVQRDATVCSLYSILLQDHTTCSGCRPHPSSGVHNTVVTATGARHKIVHLPRSNVAKLAMLEWDRCTIIWFAPVAVTTVLRTPDDGCGRHPKHVECSCSKIEYRLHIVASRWTFINKHFFSSCMVSWRGQRKLCHHFHLSLYCITTQIY